MGERKAEVGGGAMHEALGGDTSPGPNSIIIESGSSGGLWRYDLSGIQDLWVRGGLKFHSDNYTFKVENIRQIHNRIAAAILPCQVLSGAQFRFLRKEVGITVLEFVASTGMDSKALASWEDGSGFAVAGAEQEIRRMYGLSLQGRATKAPTRKRA